MADSGNSGAGPTLRVFLSHTSELRDFPVGGSYVAAVERAITVCGHVIVDMADFPAADQIPAELCRERVRGCQVYVGVLGTRYGSPVRDEPEVSHTELEFDTAAEAGLDRLVFLLDTDAADVGIPPSKLIDHEFGRRQEAFRRRVQDCGLVTQKFTDPATLGQLVERSLRELAGTSRRGGDGGQGAQVPVVVGEIPQEPLGFQPRTDLVAALDAPNSPVVVVHAVTGMRGVGKTQLAAAYARAKLADRWQLVAWINAEDLSGVLAGLSAIAAGLRLGASEGDAEAAGRAVRHWLEIGGDRCLLVFDNATDPGRLQPFIPAAGAARVIITSNLRAMANLGTSVPVDVFSEPEALAFLAERTGLADAEGARTLAAELGYLPLGLAQAAAVIADQHLGYGSYLDRLRSMPVNDLLRPVEAGQYPRGVAAAVLLSLNGVRAGDETGICASVMDFLSLLSAAGVRRALVHAAAQQGALERDGGAGGLVSEVADRALARLSGASLLSFSVDDSTVSVHRLVTRVIREQLASGNCLTSVCTAAAKLLDGLAISLGQAWHENRAAVRDLVEQITALYESSAACPADDALVDRMLRLRWRAVLFLSYLDDSSSQWIEIAEALLADRERVLGPDHPDTLATCNNLAAAYARAGRTAEAIILFEQTLTGQERVLGPDHTLSTRNNLALAYREVGRTTEAIAQFEQTLIDQERVLGADHPDTLRTRGNLASAYQTAGRVGEAIALFEQTLIGQERVLGPDHPDTLSTRTNLALAYRAAGRAGEAIALFEQTLIDQERVLGPDHPDTLRTRGNLGAIYHDAGRMGEAIALDTQTLAGQEWVLGPDHPDTLSTRTNLALAYQAAGRAGEATALFEQTLAGQERVLGADHPDTLATRNALATSYARAGRADEAIALFERTLAGQERVLGPDHPDTLRTSGSLALAYRAAGRVGEAIALFEQTLASQERVLGADHSDTLNSCNNLAAAYRAAGRTTDAITQFERTLVGQERVLGLDHPDTQQTCANLAALVQPTAHQTKSRQGITAHRTKSWPRMLRTLRLALGRVGWGVADQLVSSLTRLVVLLYGARLLGAVQFGAFSLTYVTFGFVIDASRGLATDPLLVRFSGSHVRVWRRAVADSTGTALALGLVAGVATVAAALPLGGTTKVAFLTLGLAMPGLVLQDSWRYVFFALGRGGHAFLNDTLWAAVMLLALLVLQVTSRDTVFWFVLAWGAAATVAAGVGALQAGVIPRVLNARAWLKRHRDLASRYLAENTAASVSTPLRMAFLGGISGLAAVGLVQAAQVLIGLLAAVTMVISFVALPEAARIQQRAPRYLWLFCLLLGGGLALLALAWGAVLLVALPRGLGDAILGSLWRPTYPLVLPLTLSVMGTSLAFGASTGLHALGSARRSLRVAAFTSVAIVIASVLGALTGGAVGSVRGMAVASGLTALVSWWWLRAALHEAGIASAGSTLGRSNTGQSQTHTTPKSESLADAFVALAAILFEEQSKKAIVAPTGRWSSHFLS